MLRRKRTSLRIWRNLIFCLCLLPGFGKSNEIKEGSLIRDAEIEETLKLFTEPLFKSAGLNPQHLRIFINANSDINAAASLNYSIFINTGLITKSKNPEQVIGVLAHETGHIACGHIARREESMKKSSLAALAALALGAAATLAGSPDAGAGILYGGLQVAQGSFLHYSRGQEAAADQAALRYLSNLGWSAIGLSEFMQTLARQELLSGDRQDGYLRTHPFSSDRVQLMKRHVDESPFTWRKLPSVYYDAYDRMLAKMTAFMESPMSTFMKYPASNTSVSAQYARAIAYYRNKEIDKSLSIMDALIQNYPQDSYFYELRGQILFENGRLPEAYEAYKKALALNPASDLIRLSYVQSMMEVTGDRQLDTAIQELKIVLKKEKENPLAWHLLAIAYGKKGDVGKAALALAEKAMTQDDFTLAIEQGKRAFHLLPAGPEQTRAEDIIETALELKKAEK
jgi:predicted Zn-dependent protease